MSTNGGFNGTATTSFGGISWGCDSNNCCWWVLFFLVATLESFYGLVSNSHYVN